MEPAKRVGFPGGRLASIPTPSATSRLTCPGGGTRCSTGPPGHCPRGVSVLQDLLHLIALSCVVAPWQSSSDEPQW